MRNTHTPGGSKRGVRSLVLALVVGLLATVTIGCGSSRGEFVYPTPGGQPGQTGSLVFHFEQAVLGQTVVPAGTESLRFEFFSQANASGEKTITPDPVRGFATEVRFDNVPVETNSVRITAYGSDSLPTWNYVANVEVLEGAVTEVGDIGAGVEVIVDALTIDPAEATVTLGAPKEFSVDIAFSNGQDFTVGSANGLNWSSGDENVATIDSSGVAASTGVGVATITANYRGEEATAELTVEAAPPVGQLESVYLVASPDTILAVGESVSFQVFGVFGGVQEPVEITTNSDYEFDYTVEDELADEDVLVEGDLPHTFIANSLGDAAVRVSVDAEGLEEPLVSEEIDVVVTDEFTYAIYGLELAESEDDLDTLALPANGSNWQIVVDRTPTELLGAPARQLNPSDLHYISSAGDVATVDEHGILLAGDSGYSNISVYLAVPGDDSDSIGAFQFQAVDTNFDEDNLPELTVRIAGEENPGDTPVELVAGESYAFALYVTFTGTDENEYRANVTTEPDLVFGGAALTNETAAFDEVRFNRFFDVLTANDAPEGVTLVIDDHEDFSSIPLFRVDANAPTT